MDFCSLNPMDHHEHKSSNSWIFWMDIFEIILLPFSWTLNSKFECPERRYIFPKFNPCTPVSRIFDSAIISLNHVACYIGKCFNCADTSPSCYYSFKLWWIFLFLQLWTCCEQILLYPSFTPPLLRWSPPRWGSLSWDWQLGIPLLPSSGWRSSSPSKESRYTWLWKVISLQHYIPSKRVEIRSVN